MNDKESVCSTKKDIPTIPHPTEEHHVYIEWYLNGRAGGPPGYLANLLYGVNQIEHYDKPLIVFDSYKGKQPPKAVPPKKGIQYGIKCVFSALPGGKQFFTKHLSRSQKKSFNDMNCFLSNPDEMMPDQNMMDAINWPRTKSIHVHTAAEVVKVKNYLRKNFLDDRLVILTCHTPESVANEQYALSIADGQDESRARILQAKWLELEKRAYQEADIMIFPSEEAKEPLLHDIPEFDTIIAGKDIRYMATGSKKLVSSLTKEEAKKKYGVSGKRVVGYIGRHNSIKGYDLLKKAAEQIFKQTEDVVFLVGGAQGIEFAPMDDPRWIEAGWVNPADLLQALDVFVLPNRQTYYDLVLLEVLSMGVPVVATATGGNKSVKEIAEDLELCEVDPTSLAKGISRIINLDAQERNAKGLRLREVYQNYFTEVHMAQRYVDIICQIYDDYNLWGKEQGEEA